MKKLILLSSFFTFLTSATFSQEKDSANTQNDDDELILMIGGGISHLNAQVDVNTGSFYHKHENIPTFNFEVINDIKLGDKSPWRLRVGVDIVAFNQTMISPSNSGTSTSYFIKNKLAQNFVSIPVEAAYDWYIGGKTKALIRPHAGLGLSLLTSNISNTKVNPMASSDYPNATGVESDYVTEKYNDNKIGFGMIFKAGVTFAPIPSLPNLMFDLSCSQQLIRSRWVGTNTMVNNHYNNTDHVHEYGYRNTSMLGNLSLMVGYHIPMSKR